MNKNPPMQIFEYVKERKRITGIILGLRNNDTIRTGWSKCNFKMGDEFSKDDGLRLAAGRANRLTPSPALPLCMKRQMNSFQARCIRYFKGAKTMELV